MFQKPPQREPELPQLHSEPAVAAPRSVFRRCAGRGWSAPRAARRFGPRSPGTRPCRVRRTPRRARPGLAVAGRLPQNFYPFALPGRRIATLSSQGEVFPRFGVREVARFLLLWLVARPWRSRRPSPACTASVSIRKCGCEWAPWGGPSRRWAGRSRAWTWRASPRSSATSWTGTTATSELSKALTTKKLPTPLLGPALPRRLLLPVRLSLSEVHAHLGQPVFRPATPVRQGLALRGLPGRAPPHEGATGEPPAAAALHHPAGAVRRPRRALCKMCLRECYKALWIKRNGARETVSHRRVHVKTTARRDRSPHAVHWDLPRAEQIGEDGGPDLGDPRPVSHELGGLGF